MVLHIGKNEYVNLKNILFIINLKKENQDLTFFLKEEEKKREVIYIDPSPKTAILVQKKDKKIIYYSPLSCATLLKREKRPVKQEQKINE